MAWTETGRFMSRTGDWKDRSVQGQFTSVAIKVRDRTGQVRQIRGDRIKDKLVASDSLSYHCLHFTPAQGNSQ